MRSKIKEENPRNRQIKLIIVLLGQALLILFWAVYQFYYQTLDIFRYYYFYGFFIAFFMLTTIFLLVQINFSARKEAESQIYQVKVEEAEQLVQIFENRHRNFLDCLENLEILNVHGSSEAVGTYINQVRREYENLLELVKIGVPQYIMLIIKTIYEVEEEFINISFSVDTDLKYLPVSVQDFEKLMGIFRSVRKKYMEQVHLENRHMELYISDQGSSYLFKLIYGWELRNKYREAWKAMKTLKSIVVKYRGTVKLRVTERDKTILSISLPKYSPDMLAEESGFHPEVE